MKLQEPGAEDYDILEKALKIWILYGRMQDGATPQKSAQCFGLCNGQNWGHSGR
jgi:hypothetical protein